jgi:hypothetical protein
MIPYVNFYGSMGTSQIEGVEMDWESIAGQEERVAADILRYEEPFRRCECQSRFLAKALPDGVFK